MKNTFTLTVLSFIILLFIAGEVLAIPAFARKYNMTCKTCHTPFPYLKSYGNDFANNGFQLQDKDAPRYYVETGDDRLDLLRDFPVAVRLQGFVTYNEGKKNQWDIGSPSAFKIMSGGAITKDIAYYVYYILESGEAGKIEDAWFMLNNLFDTELDFFIGQFQVSDPLFKRELRLTNDDYYIYKVRPGTSGIDLTYDRGLVFSYSFPTTSLVLEVLNGSGIGELYPNNLFDGDKYKNLMGRVSQDVGDNFRIGAMGYWGKEENEIFYIGEGYRYPKNELWMLGGDGTISFDPFELNLQYVERKDDNPNFLYDEKETVKTRGAFGELIFRPEGDESDWYGVALFNWIESDQTDLNLKQLGIHFGYLLRRNIRLVAEYSQNFTDKYGKIGLGFVTAF